MGPVLDGLPRQKGGGNMLVKWPWGEILSTGNPRLRLWAEASPVWLNVPEPKGDVARQGAAAAPR